MDQDASSSAALHQRQEDLQLRLRLLEAEAVELEARRGQAVLDGGELLAQLHRRIAEVERERADVAAAIAAIEAPLAEARELEQRERQAALQDAARSLCEQRLQAAAAIDRSLQQLARELGRWQALAQHLAPVGHELHLAEGLRDATGQLADAEALRAAVWAQAPELASLLGLDRMGQAWRPLAAGDGAHRIAMRLQPRAA